MIWPSTPAATSIAPAFSGAIADPLHQRDRERAAGDDVGDRRAGDRAHQPRRHDGGLGRPAAHVAEQRERDLDEVVARAGLLEQRAEQHEQEDVARRHAQRDAEHALGRQPVMRHRLGQRDALVRDHVGHVAARRRRSSSIRMAMIASGGPSTRRVASSSSSMPTTADDDVHRRRLARAGRDLAVEEEQIGAAERGDRGEHPVLQRDGSCAASACRTGKARIGEEQAEAEMQRAHLGRVEHEDVERERQRRRVPQLQQRPREARPRDDARRRPGGRAPSEVGLLDQRRDVDVAAHFIQPFSL